MFAEKYSRYYNLFNMDKPYQREVEFVYKWASSPSSVFDIGCGTATYWRYFPKKTSLVGIDTSEYMANGDPRIIISDVANYKTRKRFKCATALFDVLNYIQDNSWWKNIPVKKGDYFIFDVWDKEKVDTEGFVRTIKNVHGVQRIISPVKYDGKSVLLRVEVIDHNELYGELHRMYIHSHEDIERFCGREFDIVETRITPTWQRWYKCRKR